MVQRFARSVSFTVPGLASFLAETSDPTVRCGFRCARHWPKEAKEAVVDAFARSESVDVRVVVWCRRDPGPEPMQGSDPRMEGPKGCLERLCGAEDLLKIRCVRTFRGRHRES